MESPAEKEGGGSQSPPGSFQTRSLHWLPVYVRTCVLNTFRFQLLLSSSFQLICRFLFFLCFPGTAILLVPISCCLLSVAPPPGSPKGPRGRVPLLPSTYVPTPRAHRCELPRLHARRQFPPRLLLRRLRGIQDQISPGEKGFELYQSHKRGIRLSCAVCSGPSAHVWEGVSGPRSGDRPFFLTLQACGSCRGLQGPLPPGSPP